MGTLPTVALSIRLAVLSDKGAMSSLKLTVICALVAATAFRAGTKPVTKGAWVSAEAAVSNDHTKSLDMGTPNASWAPVVTVATHKVLAGNKPSGTKLTTRLFGS